MTTIQHYVVYKGKAYTTERLFRKLGLIPKDCQQVFTIFDNYPCILMKVGFGYERVIPTDDLKHVVNARGQFKAEGREFIYINC